MSDDLSLTRTAEPIAPDPVALFVVNLRGLKRNERALLARCLGRPLGRALEGGVDPQSLRVFFALLPRWYDPTRRRQILLAPARQQPTYFLVATLYASVPEGGQGSFGASLRRAVHGQPRLQASMDAALTALVRASAYELPLHLSRIARRTNKTLRLDYEQLLTDLLAWDNGRHVARRWSRDYYANSE